MGPVRQAVAGESCEQLIGRREGNKLMQSSFPLPQALALGDGASVDGHVSKAPLQPGTSTAHAESAAELFARAGLKNPDLSPAQRRHQARPTTLHLQGGSHGVLLFHGLSSTPAELNYLARGLNRAGYTVRVPVVEGYSHGLGTRKDKGHQDWTAAALAAFDSMRSQYATVSVGGLCIGSLLALSVTAARPGLVSTTLGLSTTLRYDGWANPWTRHLLHLLRYVPIAREMRVREREPFGVKDERLRALIAKQMRASGTSDAGASQLRVQDLLEAQQLGRRIRRSLHSITTPTLLIHAKEDESASPRSSFEVAKGVSSRHVKLVLLSNSYHMISIDRERARVLGELKGFLGEHLEREGIDESQARRVSRQETDHPLGQTGRDLCVA